MRYETLKIELLGRTEEHVLIFRDDDSVESFPADENNPRYIQFLEETAE